MLHSVECDTARAGSRIETQVGWNFCRKQRKKEDLKVSEKQKKQAKSLELIVGSAVIVLVIQSKSQSSCPVFETKSQETTGKMRHKNHT